MLTSFVAVGLGGAIGALCRYSLVLLITRGLLAQGWMATLGANIIGCFLMGIAGALLASRSADDSLRLLFMTGMLGGFTTFSAFAFDSFSLIRQGLSGLALLYLFGTVILSLVAFLAGSQLVSLLGRASS